MSSRSADVRPERSEGSASPATDEQRATVTIEIPTELLARGGSLTFTITPNRPEPDSKPEPDTPDKDAA